MVLLVWLGMVVVCTGMVAVLAVCWGILCVALVCGSVCVGRGFRELRADEEESFWDELGL
jgi:hypothetical protein